MNSDKAIKPFSEKIWLSSPTMHGDEKKWICDAIDKNWVSTIGENINVVEKTMSDLTDRKYSVGLSCGTSALHLAVRLCGEKIYGRKPVDLRSLLGKKVFCCDLTFSATANPIVYEGGEPVFIDSEYETWNMDPEALEKAFSVYPDVKIIIIVHLYGTPAKMDELTEIADRHGAIIIEDAAESFGSSYKGKQTGGFGTYSVVSFNGNKIITGSSGGVFLCDDEADAALVRKWSTQSRETAPWYQHREMGFNYRMSNIVAGVVRGQLPYLQEHIDQKTAIYERYKKGFSGMPVRMNPIGKDVIANHWLSCILIDKEAMCDQMRTATETSFVAEDGKSCPTQILQALEAINAEGRPIWKPMHLQPTFEGCGFVTKDGLKAPGEGGDVSSDIFERGLCLPSDNKLSAQDQDVIIELVRSFFSKETKA